MGDVTPRLLLVLFVSAIVLLTGAAARGEDEAATVASLIRNLKDPDFQIASSAAQTLSEHPRFKAQIVPALIEAIKTRDWKRCGGDMRDYIARALMQLKAREAVPALLELAASDKPIDHECVE